MKRFAMKVLGFITRRKATNVRVRNLVYDMCEYRQSPRAVEIDLLYRKNR